MPTKTEKADALFKTTKTEVKPKFNISPKVTALTLYREADEGFNSCMTKVAQALSNEPKPEVVAMIFHTLNSKWKKLVEDNVKGAKALMAAFVEDKGEATENGKGKVALLEYNGRGYKASTVKSMSSLPDAAKLEELLDRKGLNKARGFDRVISYEVNPEKVALLIEEEMLTEAEVLSCHVVTATTTKVEAF